MAAPANAIFTYDIGHIAGSSNQEDVYQTIQTLTPFDTPGFLSFPKVKAILPTVEWLTDALAATATGGTLEGDTFTAAARVNRARKANNTQIFSLGVEVTDSQAAASPYGMSGEYPYQVSKVYRELHRNIESRLFINTGFERVTGDESTIAVMASLRATGWGAPPSSAVNGAITTAAVENVFELVYSEGGNPDRLYVSPGVKADFTNAAQASGVNRMFNLAASDMRLVANVTVYEGNFGTLIVVPDKFISQSSVTASAHAFHLLETARCQIAVFRPMKHVPIAKVGDSTRGYVVTEISLKVLHASANGFGTGITT